jgi:mannan endo-1,4-beta-mannosidase
MIPFVRRLLPLILSILAAAVSAPVPAAEFVQVEGRHFVLDHRPLYVCGTNLWYGAHLGRPSNPVGRARLLRELDRLQELGVNNLRVLGSGEQCDFPNTLRPAIQTAPGVLNEDLLIGLDFLISEAGRRKITLVLFLNNYWDWSGGIPQYLAWATGKPAVGLDGLPWKEWNRLQSTFYTNERAMNLYRHYLAQIVDRTNTLTGRKYRDESAIMAWELANEPRPGEREGDSAGAFSAFVAWIDSTSAYIHSLDPHHLVTTGSEGFQGGLYSDEKFRTVHAVKGIDYATFHLWPKNWGWFDLKNWAGTIQPTIRKSRDYAGRHLAGCDLLNKPVVIEEFGLDRDGGLGVEVPTTSRDRLYAAMFALIEDSAAHGGSAAGSNFWLWGGEGRPPQLGNAPDGIGAGDMQQEESGRNTVFDCDGSTLKVMREHFARLQKLGQSRPY